MRRLRLELEANVDGRIFTASRVIEWPSVVNELDILELDILIAEYLSQLQAELSTEVKNYFDKMTATNEDFRKQNFD